MRNNKEGRGIELVVEPKPESSSNLAGHLPLKGGSGTIL